MLPENHTARLCQKVASTAGCTRGYVSFLRRSMASTCSPCAVHGRNCQGGPAGCPPLISQEVARFSHCGDVVHADLLFFRVAIPQQAIEPDLVSDDLGRLGIKVVAVDEYSDCLKFLSHAANRARAPVKRRSHFERRAPLFARAAKACFCFQVA